MDRGTQTTRLSARVGAPKSRQKEDSLSVRMSLIRCETKKPVAGLPSKRLRSQISRSMKMGCSKKALRAAATSATFVSPERCSERTSMALLSAAKAVA